MQDLKSVLSDSRGWGVLSSSQGPSWKAHFSPFTKAFPMHGDASLVVMLRCIEFPGTVMTMSAAWVDRWLDEGMGGQMGARMILHQLLTFKLAWTMFRYSSLCPWILCLLASISWICGYQWATQSRSWKGMSQSPGPTPHCTDGKSWLREGKWFVPIPQQPGSSVRIGTWLLWTFPCD